MMYLSTRTIWAAIIGLSVLAVLGIAVTLYVLFGHPHAPSGGTVVLAAGAGVVIGAYGWSLARHPWRNCRRCSGSGGHVDTTMWKGTYGRCTRCQGAKGFPRLGVRVLTPSRARELRAGKRGRFG